jgi:hypothetical protein
MISDAMIASPRRVDVLLTFALKRQQSRPQRPAFVRLIHIINWFRAKKKPPLLVAHRSG